MSDCSVCPLHLLRLAKRFCLGRLEMPSERPALFLSERFPESTVAKSIAEVGQLSD